MEAEYFLNGWLKPCHNITMTQVEESHPEWMKEPQKHTRDFYNTYQVSQEQHDEWYIWAINEIAKKYRCSKKKAKHDFALAYLNVAPSVHINNSQTNIESLDK